MREERVYLGHITEFQDKKYYFKGTAENIAKFIIQNYQYSTVITDNDGAIICRSVVGGYLDADNKEVMAVYYLFYLNISAEKNLRNLYLKRKKKETITLKS